MENGRITELGRHEELVAADTSYTALWRAWAGSSAEGRPADEADPNE